MMISLMKLMMISTGELRRISDITEGGPQSMWTLGLVERRGEPCNLNLYWPINFKITMALRNIPRRFLE